MVVPLYFSTWPPVGTLEDVSTNTVYVAVTAGLALVKAIFGVRHLAVLIRNVRLAFGIAVVRVVTVASTTFLF